MDQTNLDIHGHPPIPWSRAEKQLETAERPEHDPFLATVRPDGRPHVAGVGALWVDGKFYIVSGAGTRKSRTLPNAADCVISVKLADLDLDIEGAAAKVTDDATLQRWPSCTTRRAGRRPWRTARSPRLTAHRARGHHRGISTNSRRRLRSAWRRPSRTAQRAGASRPDERAPRGCVRVRGGMIRQGTVAHGKEAVWPDRRAWTTTWPP